MKTVPYSVIAQSVATTDFIACANAYTAFIENKPEPVGAEYLARVQQLLLSLYQTATRLEQVELINDSDYEHDVASAIGNVKQNIAGGLQENRYYWIKSDPVITDDEPNVCGDVWDDLTDIYTDIKRCLHTWDTDTLTARENALWQFKFDFENHWGRHCINALYAIHYFLVNK